MITSRRRDRTLVFRLNQSEYDRLMAAAMSRGDRSVSEFIRLAVMGAIEPSDNRVHELEQRIQRLEQQLLCLPKS
jgi:uncharacterized protein (DUF1778 family)